MNAERLRRLLVAPEMIVVNLVVSAVDALRLALVAEHPLLDDDLAAPDDPPVQRAARTALRRALRVRRALRDYRTAVDAVLTELDAGDEPF